MSFFNTPAVVETCKLLHVPYLAADSNLALLLFGCTFFFAMQWASHSLSPHLFPHHFATFNRKTRCDWDLHFTGWIHALISTPASLYLILHPSPALAADPIFSYASLEGAVFAFSGGYFAYDLLISLWLVRTHGVPFVIHASACCFIFFKAFTPILMGVGPNFLVWEFSTIFLHPHWWLDKLNVTGSVLQLVNGAFLLLSFFGARIAWGGYMTYVLWHLLDNPRMSPSLRWGFRAANIALNVLNWSWFRLMILSVLSRLKKREDGKAGDGTAEPGKKKEL
ncbi:TLC domain-domain-containing protein [Leucosporidium creatinivorum]|uniref:TLC domain-domain-containing protein n=1 Tax=Leucosporidium creatinivorum TaxID=106004 RepID=A0A1Y2ETU9_9BASI|nr:TLC domain-domain-containing protein [Leucosporidium creatinivorum]